MIVYVAIGLAVLVLYPFGAGLTYRTRRPKGPKPAGGCACQHRFDYGGAYMDRCGWHKEDHVARWDAYLWPLVLMVEAVAVTITHGARAFKFAPRALFRLGAGTLTAPESNDR